MKRIGIVVLILCVCLVSAAWAQQPAGKCCNNWTEFHRINMMRRNPCERVLNLHNVRGLGLKWSYITGNQVHSSPAVANGVVYVGSDDGSVYAFSLKQESGVAIRRNREQLPTAAAQ
ncbi:MAG: PQQ-binding-like beta-propeller repeat protein [Terriglobales bacterium]